MIPTNSQKRGVETFVVAKAAQGALPTSGTLVGSNGNINLADGQLGIVSVSPYGGIAMNSFTDANPTFTEAPVIGIYQGTQYSANVVGSSATYPLWVRPFEKTQDISGRQNNIIVTKQPYRLDAHNVWVLGAPSTNAAAAVNTLNSTEYRLNIGFRSRRYDELMATQVQSANLTVSTTTPDWALGFNNDLKIDYILTNLGYEVNRNSSAFLSFNRYRGTSPVIALGIGTVATNGTAIGSLTAGSTLAVFNYKGIVRSITLTQAMLTSIVNAATNAGYTPATSYVYTIDLASAASATGGLISGLMFVALDHKPVYEDWIPQVKVNLQVGLPSGFDFNTVQCASFTNLDEGQGFSRQLDLWYKNTAGQRKYTQKHTTDPVINFPSPIVDGTVYNTYVIHHGTTSNPDINSLVYAPKREVVLIPRYSTGIATNPLIALFETAMNTWLESTGNTAIKE
jgi:hypothetical protein